MVRSGVYIYIYILYILYLPLRIPSCIFTNSVHDHFTTVQVWPRRHFLGFSGPVSVCIAPIKTPLSPLPLASHRAKPSTLPAALQRTLLDRSPSAAVSSVRSLDTKKSRREKLLLDREQRRGNIFRTRRPPKFSGHHLRHPPRSRDICPRNQGDVR